MSSVAFELQDELAALADLETYQIPGDDEFSLDDCEQLLEGWLFLSQPTFADLFSSCGRGSGDCLGDNCH